ncbi:hypothetical protein AAHA92_23539 [Salvia divinorum]|uniref:Uncharacterized protein n=1 Tax=Salvia divinorum TaxID=28513 RepID=A0ABD1GVF7_SALDI
MATLDESILAKLFFLYSRKINFKWNRRSVIINYGGKWNGCDYINGDEELLLITSGGISRAALMEEIHHIIEHDKKKSECLLFCLVEIDGSRKIKLRIKNDVDLSYIFATFQEPLFYVILNPKETNSSPLQSYSVVY